MSDSIYFQDGPKNIYAILRRSVPLRGPTSKGGEGKGAVVGREGEGKGGAGGVGRGGKG